MQGRSTAINILEADGAELEPFPTIGILHETLLASAWRRPTPYLSAAVQRAFSWRYAVVKRTLDILLSSILIVLFFPVMLAVAIAVAVTSPGPIFFYQERLGRFGASSASSSFVRCSRGSTRTMCSRSMASITGGAEADHRK